MPLQKIELHEVNENLRQAKESAESVSGLQSELEDVLAKYNDNSKRYAAGELSREEFSDMTRSKEEDVHALNAKVKNNVNVIMSSLDAIKKITVVQEPADERAEKEVSLHKKAAKPAVKKAAKHHAKKK